MNVLPIWVSSGAHIFSPQTSDAESLIFSAGSTITRKVELNGV